MRIFANKNIWKKLVLIIIVITVISFAIPQQVQAADSIGGALMLPVCNLLVTLCDGIVNVVHRFTVSQNQTLIRISLTSGLLETLVNNLVTVMTVTAGVIFALLLIITPEAFTTCLGYAILGSLALGAAVCVYDYFTDTISAENAEELMGIGITAMDEDLLPDEIVIPLYHVSPEEIFKGDVALFDVNFFDPDTNYYTTGTQAVLDSSSSTTTSKTWFVGRSQG